jgi:hypothetical protein
LEIVLDYDGQNAVDMPDSRLVTVHERLATPIPFATIMPDPTLDRDSCCQGF